MNQHALELIRYRVIAKPYSSWRAIIAELGESDTLFLIALRELHGVYIDKSEDPMLYVVQDTQQTAMMGQEGVADPTFLQILLTSKAIALTSEESVERWNKAMEEFRPDTGLN